MFKVHHVLPSGAPSLAFLVPLLPLTGVYGGRTTRMGVKTPATVAPSATPSYWMRDYPGGLGVLDTPLLVVQVAEGDLHMGPGCLTLLCVYPLPCVIRFPCQDTGRAPHFASCKEQLWRRVSHIAVPNFSFYRNFSLGVLDTPLLVVQVAEGK
jgi:hypothetical protein